MTETSEPIANALTIISISNPPTVTVPPNTHQTTTFVVSNSGVGAGPVRLVCSSVRVTCNSTAPIIFTIQPDEAVPVPVGWFSGANISGTVRLTDQLSNKTGAQRINIR